MSKKKKKKKIDKKDIQENLLEENKKKPETTKESDNKKDANPKVNKKTDAKKGKSIFDIHKKDIKDKKKFIPSPPLNENPLIRILDQHQEHKMRIAKICASIFVLMIILIIFFLYLSNSLKNKEYDKQVAKRVKLLEIQDKRIAENEGFDQDKAIVKAINETYRIENIDYHNAKKWKSRRDSYLMTLAKKFIIPKKGKDFICKSIAAEMISIPQGHFNMGRSVKEHGASSELPQHNVQISYPFWMAKTEISNAQYRIFYYKYRVKDWNGYSFNGVTQPVVNISWHLANEYCEMLTYHERKAKRLPEDYVYRLPTEAEWEYACRAGTPTFYYWGDEFGKIGSQYANILDKRSARHLKCNPGPNAPDIDGNYVTAPVGSYKPNAFGLYDMSGNAWEWCWDWYNPKAYRELFSNDPVQVQPVVSTLIERGDFEREFEVKTTTKVIRGGGCLSPAKDVRSATRDHLQPEKRDIGVGFRIVLAPAIKYIAPEEDED
jgi:formylglycine-generating enzyme required for sulfatase activity